MSTTEANEYVLGTDEIELARLGVQHRLWSDAAAALWRRANVQPGMTALDLGCGPGHGSFDLAQLVGPTGRVIGVDISERFVASYNRRAEALAPIDGVTICKAYQGEAHRLAAVIAPELEAGRLIDAVYCRWMLCFVPNPEEVIASLASILRPGAAVMVQDYFNYEAMTLAPRRDEMTRVVSAIAQSIRHHGGDPDVMGRLPGMLRDHGFRVDHLAQTQRIARPGSSMWAWPTTFWQSIIPRLVASGALTEDDGEAFAALWTEVSADNASFMHLPTVYETVAIRL